MSALSILLFLFPPSADADGLDKDAIRSVVRAKIAEVRSCYNDGLRRDADLEGRISIRFEIDARGDVANAKVVDADFDEGVPKCMVEAAEDWEFPSSDAKTVVVYPFLFSPA